MAEHAPPGEDQGDPDLTRPGQPVVLLADDHDDFRATIAFHLAMAGYPVIETGSVAGVVARSRAVHPDVLIVSDALGDHDIAHILGVIAGQPNLIDVPVITLSSEQGPERLIECLSHGARDHVRRQDGADELIARVDAVLRTDEQLERLRRRNAELEFLGTVDPLTGMPNRRHLEQELDRLGAGARRHGLALSAVMARADEPPTESHPLRRRPRTAGIQRELAYLLAAVRRTDDFAAVWDERTFVILLPVTTLDGARQFAERLRVVVNAAPLRCADELVPVTLSCACAEVGEPPETVLATLELAVLSVQTGGGDRTWG